jgi:hypothetical protein
MVLITGSIEVNRSLRTALLLRRESHLFPQTPTAVIPIVSNKMQTKAQPSRNVKVKSRSIHLGRQNESRKLGPWDRPVLEDCRFRVGRRLNLTDVLHTRNYGCLLGQSAVFSSNKIRLEGRLLFLRCFCFFKAILRMTCFGFPQTKTLPMGAHA